jgi:hypothetical protein
MADKIEGWFRKLDGDRMEIFLKVESKDMPDRKIRASGPETEMYELADWFEQNTGLRFSSPKWRRVRKGHRPLAGQVDMMELLSEDKVEDDGELSGLRG